MNQAGKILLLAAGGLLLSKFAFSKSNTVNFAPSLAPHADKLSLLQNHFKKAGLNSLQVKLLLSQILHETGNFSPRSNVARLNNNYSGIMFINKPYQKNAVKGSKYPAKEGNYYYAKFNTVQDWANDFIRVLSMRNKPIAAPGLNEYVFRLARNGYFVPNTGKAYDNYQKGLKKYYDLLTV